MPSDLRLIVSEGLAWLEYNPATRCLGILTLECLGFPVAAILLFGCGARGFRSRRWLRDGGIGLALGLAVYLLFPRLLGVSLPGGPFLG